MSTNSVALPPSSETGAIGIMHLKRYWAKSIAQRNGLIPNDALLNEWHTDNFLLNTLGLGLEQTIKQLFQEQLGFREFEQWIVKVNQDSVSQIKIEQFNNWIQRATENTSTAWNEEPVLTAEDIDNWNVKGYVIVKNAVPVEDCQQAIQSICDLIQIDINDPDTWYRPHPAKEGIMVQLFQHPVIDRNRHAPRIRKAYEQLWQRNDIFVNTDKVGFNPPEKEGWKFPASRLHWDVSLQQPVPFGTQGVLYLSNTAANQGAFSAVAGFHNCIEEWLNQLKPGTNPRTEDLYAFGVDYIAANAGDFIIWHHALPHAASPNTGTSPRFVQYINYAPVDSGMQVEWK